MTLVKDPAERFGQVIGCVNDTRNEVHRDVASVFPVLDREMLNVNMSGALRGTRELIILIADILSS